MRRSAFVAGTANSGVRSSKSSSATGALARASSAGLRGQGHLLERSPTPTRRRPLATPLVRFTVSVGGCAYLEFVGTDILHPHQRFDRMKKLILCILTFCLLVATSLLAADSKPQFAQSIERTTGRGASKFFTQPNYPISNPPFLFRVNPLGEPKLYVSVSKSDVENIHSFCHGIKTNLANQSQLLKRKSGDLALLGEGAVKASQAAPFFLTRHLDNWRVIQYPILGVQTLNNTIELDVMDFARLEKAYKALQNLTPAQSDGADAKYEITPTEHPWLNDILLHGVQRFEDMSRGMRNYGVTISANNVEKDKTLFLSNWKQIAVDAYPQKGGLITAGSFKGFIMLESGDLFVPGEKFIQEALAGRIDLTLYDRLDYTFRDAFPDMIAAAKRRDHQEVKRIYGKVWDNGYLGDFQRALLAYQMAEACYETAKVFEKGKLVGLDSETLSVVAAKYDLALKYFPQMHEAHYSVFNLLFQLGLKEKARASLDLAIKYAPKEEAKRYRTIKADNL